MRYNPVGPNYIDLCHIVFCVKAAQEVSVYLISLIQDSSYFPSQGQHVGIGGIVYVLLHIVDIH